MKKVIRKFWNDQLGNAAIDWFVLGTGISSLCVAVVTSFG